MLLLELGPRIAIWPESAGNSLLIPWAFRADVAGARHVEHLLLELREATDVADLALRIEGGNRLGPHRLTARSRDGLDRHVRAGRLDDVLDHGATEVAFGDDAVGPELVIGGDGKAAPLGRPEPGRAVGQHIALAVAAEPGHHDADLVRALALAARGAGGVDRHHDPLQGGHGAAALKESVEGGAGPSLDAGAV